MPRLPLRIALCLGAVAVLAGASKPVPPPLQYGRWKERIELTKMTFAGEVMPFEAGENRVFVQYRCHAPGTGGPAGFFGPQMPREKCGTVNGGIGGGRINLSAKCDFGHGPADVSIIGTYARTTQNSEVRMETTVPGDQKMVLESKVNGTFEGPCRGDEQRPRPGMMPGMPGMPPG